MADHLEYNLDLGMESQLLYSLGSEMADHLEYNLDLGMESQLLYSLGPEMADQLEYNRDLGMENHKEARLVLIVEIRTMVERRGQRIPIRIVGGLAPKASRK
jgi:hypothetical protein